MKKFIFLMVLSVTILSCQKDQSILIKDIPDWLNDNISALEKEIRSDPKTMAAFTAWARYEWKNEYYFEYFDFSRSYLTGPKRIDGQILGIGDPLYTTYQNEKCCMEYVWKGPKY